MLPPPGDSACRDQKQFQLVEYLLDLGLKENSHPENVRYGSIFQHLPPNEHDEFQYLFCCCRLIRSRLSLAQLLVFPAELSDSLWAGQGKNNSSSQKLIPYKFQRQ